MSNVKRLMVFLGAILIVTVAATFSPKLTIADPAFQAITVCHLGSREISFNEAALEKHLDHGDAIGECPAK